MAMQQVEFEFPDPDKKAAAVVEVEQEEEDLRIEVEDAVGRETIGKKKKTLKVDDVEIEVVDDTPPADRNKKPSTPLLPNKARWDPGDRSPARRNRVYQAPYRLQQSWSGEYFRKRGPSGCRYRRSIDFFHPKTRHKAS